MIYYYGIYIEDGHLINMEGKNKEDARNNLLKLIRKAEVKRIGKIMNGFVEE